MKRNCQDVQERLDRALEGPLTAAEERELAEHGRGCPNCATLLRLRGHVERGDPDAVPDERIRDVWPRLDAALASREGPNVERPRRAHVWALAATLAAVGLIAGWLGLQNARLRDRVQELASATVSPTAAVGWTDTGAQPSYAVSWGRRTVTVGELRELLAELPPDVALLTADEVDWLLRRERRGVFGPVGDRQMAAAAGRDLNVATARELLARLDPSTTVSLPPGALSRVTAAAEG